jgi:hypothetical protein
MAGGATSLTPLDSPTQLILFVSVHLRDRHRVSAVIEATYGMPVRASRGAGCGADARDAVEAWVAARLAEMRSRRQRVPVPLRTRAGGAASPASGRAHWRVRASAVARCPVAASGRPGPRRRPSQWRHPCVVLSVRSIDDPAIGWSAACPGRIEFAAGPRRRRSAVLLVDAQAGCSGPAALGQPPCAPIDGSDGRR